MVADAQIIVHKQLISPEERNLFQPLFKYISEKTAFQKISFSYTF